MDWYTGPSLLEYLEGVSPRAASDVPGRFPVQVVIRPQTAEYPDYRGYAGRVEGGTFAVGDEVVVLPGGRSSTVTAIDTPDGALEQATPGRSVTLRLGDDIDIARGDLIAADRAPRPEIVRELTATVCWLVAEPLRAGARLLLRHTTRQVVAIVDVIESRLDIATLTSNAADELGLNDIGRIRLRTAEPLVIDPYEINRSTGAFLLVDEASGATVSAGMVARS
jgi:sulfate adenylyltransferase subunit 1